MNTPSTSPELLRHALTTLSRGILGLVDNLLAVSREHGIQLDWKADQCRVRFRDGGPPGWIEVPLRKSVVRAALARVAVLCNQRAPNSVSPYGGRGELLAGADPTTPMRVAFVNTPEEQSLELAPLRNESMPSLATAALEGQTSQSGRDRHLIGEPVNGVLVIHSTHTQLDDLEGEQLAEVVREHGASTFVLNLSGVVFVSPSFLSGLVKLRRQVQSADGRIVICNVGKEVQEIFLLTHLDQLFSIYSNQQEALQFG